MTKRIYNVSYELRWDYDKFQWSKEDVNILANGDARKAIEMVEKRVMNQVFVEENNPKVTHKPIAFRLREVTIQAETTA